MKKLLFSSLILLVTISVHGQSKKKKDQNAIKDMCGCYEVTFHFAETFNYSKDADYKPSKTKIDKGLEWVALVEDDNNKISMQHLLQVGNPESPMIVKHWRQDWEYENTHFYMYNGDNNWLFEEKNKKDVKKQWTQKVYQVDDSPRYEGSGTWVHVDGKSYWENTTTAPLPRREYTQRSDYNITLRSNRHEITKNGWIHDQNNSKINREAGKEDVLIANEKGYNTYVKVANSRCQPSQDWWEANQNKWQTVRNKWEDVFNRNKDLTLHTKVDNMLLYKKLFNEAITEKNEINKIIESFVK